jgi:cohesin loading factor subunit SCC2
VGKSSDAAFQDNLMDVTQTTPQTEAKNYNNPALMRTSVIIAMVMLLKAHLKALYSLSEE